MSIFPVKQPQSATFEKTMFAEYTLKPEAHKKVVASAFTAAATFILGPLLVWGCLALIEPETLTLFNSGFYYIIGLACFAGMYTGIKTYVRLKRFRMITTDADLQVKIQMNMITIRYDQITKVERTPDNVLMIYTLSSERTPVLSISDTITNRDTLEAILRQFVPITEGNKLPLLLRKHMRLVFGTLFIATLLLHFVSHNGNTIVITGTISIGMLTWTLVVLGKFMREVPRISSFIAVILIILLMLARMVLAFNSAFLP